jgi:hypothetical protein
MKKDNDQNEKRGKLGGSFEKKKIILTKWHCFLKN